MVLEARHRGGQLARHGHAHAQAFERGHDRVGGRTIGGQQQNLISQRSDPPNLPWVDSDHRGRRRVVGSGPSLAIGASPQPHPTAPHRHRTTGGYTWAPPFSSAARRSAARAGHIPWEGDSLVVRRYELMLVIRPDAPDEQVQALIDRQTRTIVTAGGQIIKVSPWGRRRLAYPSVTHREGSYFIIVFDAPSEAVARARARTEHHRGSHAPPRDACRATHHLAPARRVADEEEHGSTTTMRWARHPDEDDVDLETEFIDESESEAAPAATDRP